MTQPASANIATATLAGGCFWCIETAFNQIRGVRVAECGYTNGAHPAPTYQLVSSGSSGHTEAVRVEFDTSVISFRELLEIFFSLHNPTELNRQGNDVGSQYRGGIYYHNGQQKEIALAIIEEMTEQAIWDQPIVTEVLTVENYVSAESYHQDYFAKNPGNMYCNMVIAPKLMKFKQTFARYLK